MPCSFRNPTITCLVASSLIYGLVTYQYFSQQKITTFFLFASAYINGPIKNRAGFSDLEKIYHYNLQGEVSDGLGYNTEN
jgi:hypothetical protein